MREHSKTLTSTLPITSASPRVEVVTALVSVVIPMVAAAVGMVVLATRGISRLQLILMLVMYALTYSFGMEIGLHRYFSHKAFEVSRGLKIFLCIVSSMCMEGPAIFWATIHRRHHAVSDAAGDPHSPFFKRERRLTTIGGLWHAHMGWMLTEYHQGLADVVRYSPDLLQDGLLIARLTGVRLYFLWAILGIVLPGIIAGAVTGSWNELLLGILWGGLVRIFLVQHLTWIVNSLGHFAGFRPFETGDRSANNPLLAPITFGSALHNNHHAFPGAADLTLNWWHVDPSGWIIRLLGAIGLASRIHRPTREAIELRRRG